MSDTTPLPMVGSEELKVVMPSKNLCMGIQWTMGTIAISDALDVVFEAYKRGDYWTWGGRPLLDAAGTFHFHLIDQAFLLTENHGERIQDELKVFAEALEVQVIVSVSHPSGERVVLLTPKPKVQSSPALPLKVSAFSQRHETLAAPPQDQVSRSNHAALASPMLLQVAG